MHGCACCALALLLSLAACSSAPPHPATAAPASAARPAPDDLAVYRRACTEAASQRKTGTPTAYALSLDLINSGHFSQLTPGEQHQMLTETAALGMRLRDFAFAYHLWIRATELPDSTAEDWLARSRAAYQLDERADSAHAMAVVAQRWPGWLTVYNPHYILEVSGWTPRSLEERRAQFELCRGLFDAGWKGDGLEPSYAWSALIRLYVEQGEQAAAISVLARENDPEQILALRVDKRFDALAASDPAHLDVEAATRRWVDERRAAMLRTPDSLGAVEHLTSAYLHVGRNTEALDLTTQALAKVAAASSPRAAYEDAEVWLNWIWDARSSALRRLGRWPEAEEAMRHAADLPEAGGANASNVSNLASLYAELGRGDEALATLRRYSGPLTDYGNMDLQYVKLKAAIARHDGEQEQAALAFLRMHQLDAIGIYQAALVYASRLDDAEALLIQRLRDPELRTSALLRVQGYLEPRSTQLVEEARQRWRNLLARPQVQAQIRSVGRIETLPLPWGPF